MRKDNQEKEFPTKKDLCYWIIILTLFIVGIFTFYYASDGDVISHIGLGGTITSILLAVVAIIYSFYQSSTYENITYKLDTSAQKIEDATEQLSDVSEIKSVVDEFTKEVGDIKFSISELKEVINTIDSGVNVISENLKEQGDFLSTIKSPSQDDAMIKATPFSVEYFKDVLSNGGILPYYCLYVVNEAAKGNIETVDLMALNKIYAEQVTKAEFKNEENYYRSLQFSVMGFINAFRQAGFFEVEFETVNKLSVKNISPKLSEAIEEEFNATMKRKEHYLQGFLLIDEELEQSK